MQVSANSMNKEDIDIALKSVAKKTIFFAHQSVGRNILAGIQDVSLEHKVVINVFPVEGALSAKTAGIYQILIGKNGHPESKIDQFYNVLSRANKKPDIAFLKLCFVDVTAKTDINSLFVYYKKIFNKIRAEYPEIEIVHFTVPLKTNQTSWKTTIKSLLGKNNWEFADNIKRNQFNRLLLAEYRGKEPVFDIAGIESTYDNGQRETFVEDDIQYFSLIPDYSSDGGHLNGDGRVLVASKLLLFLYQL